MRSTTSLLAALALVATAAPLSAAEPCAKPFSLSTRPAWLNSAVWVPPPVGKVLAVDSMFNRLILYDSDGKGTVLPIETYPALLAVTGDRILLKRVGREVESLDSKTLDDLRAQSSLKTVRTSDGPLAAVYEWTAQDRALLATGLVLNDKLPGGFRAGLFRFSAEDEPGRVAERLVSIDAWDYYVIGYQYLTTTTVGGVSTGYFLDMDRKPGRDYGTARLYKIPSGGPATELPGAVPPEVRGVPYLNATLNGPQDAPALFSKLAGMAMATGIYGGPDGNVYLLAREPLNGTNTWWLFRISPDGVLLGKARLPSRAQHLSIVVSPDTFYLFEKGTVNPYGGQDIETGMAIPTRVLAQAPLQGKGTEVCLSPRQ